jgi:hypothetical protein
MISFEQEDSSDWNFSVYLSRLQEYTVFSPLLDISGSAGFGTWRIFVPLFWATCRLFSSFLLFWILEPFCLWILYTLFTLVLLRYQGGVFWYCGLSILCLPFVPLRQKWRVYVSFWTINVFLTGLVNFLQEWPNGEFVSFWLATFCWQNHYYVLLLLYFRVFRYSEFISLMWKESYYDKLQVSQASGRLFQCSRKILYRFQIREVGSQATLRTMWCSRSDAFQLATSVRTTRTFRPNVPQCLEASALKMSGRQSNTSGR